MTDEIPTQRASNAENVSIWWRHNRFDFFAKLDNNFLWWNVFFSDQGHFRPTILAVFFMNCPIRLFHCIIIYSYVILDMIFELCIKLLMALLCFHLKPNISHLYFKRHAQRVCILWIHGICFVQRVLVLTQHLCLWFLVHEMVIGKFEYRCIPGDDIQCPECDVILGLETIKCWCHLPSRASYFTAITK